MNFLHIEDPLGRFWVGTANGGLNLLNRQTGRFVRILHDPGNEATLSNNHIKSLLSDEKGDLWVGTYGGGLNKLLLSEHNGNISEFNPVKIIHFTSTPLFPEAQARVNALAIDRFQKLWIGTYKGIYSLDLSLQDQGFRTEEIQLRNPALNSGNVAKEDLRLGGRVIFEDKFGELWMGNGAGLFVYDRYKKIFEHYLIEGKEFFTSQIISALAWENKGVYEIWLGATNGITRFNPSSDWFTL